MQHLIDTSAALLRRSTLTQMAYEGGCTRSSLDFVVLMSIVPGRTYLQAILL